MENLECNLLPVPISNIKDIDDSIIEGCCSKITDNDVVIEWDIRQKRKMIKFSIDPNHKTLEDVLADYLRTLKEQTIQFKERKLLKERILNHLKLFHECYVELRRQNFTDSQSYLDHIEGVLLAVCNLELEITRRMKRNHTMKEVVRYCRQAAQTMLNILSIYLFQEKKRIFHVLLKMDHKYEPQPWKNIMALVYKHFLITIPVIDRSDESFCRHYLLFQKWKGITEDRQHQSMDRVMYFKFQKTQEEVFNNKNLKAILMPATDSIVDLVEVLTNGRQAPINAYFQYLKKKNAEEDSLPQIIDLDSDGEDDDVTQTSVFNSEGSTNQVNRIVKSEKSTERHQSHENVQYFEMPVNGQLVCVIDDDSDVEEIVEVNDKPGPKFNNRRTSQRPTSFLDSIIIPDDESSNSAQIQPASVVMEESITSTTSDILTSSSLPFLTTYLKYLRNIGSEETPEESDNINIQSLHISENQEGSSATTTTEIISNKTDSNISTVNNATVSEMEMSVSVVNESISEAEAQSTITHNDFSIQCSNCDTEEPKVDNLKKSKVVQTVDCGVQANFDDVQENAIQDKCTEIRSSGIQCDNEHLCTNTETNCTNSRTKEIEIQTQSDLSGTDTVHNLEITSNVNIVNSVSTNTISDVNNVDTNVANEAENVDSSKNATEIDNTHDFNNIKGIKSVKPVQFFCGMVTPPSDTTNDEIGCTSDVETNCADNHINSNADKDYSYISSTSLNNYELDAEMQLPNNTDKCVRFLETASSTAETTEHEQLPDEMSVTAEGIDQRSMSDESFDEHFDQSSLHVDEVNLNEVSEREVSPGQETDQDEEPDYQNEEEETEYPRSYSYDNQDRIEEYDNVCEEENDLSETSIDESYTNLKDTIEKSRNSESDVIQKEKPSNTIILSNIKVADGTRNGGSDTIELFVQDIPDEILKALSKPQIDDKTERPDPKTNENSSALNTNHAQQSLRSQKDEKRKIQASINVIPYLNQSSPEKAPKKLNGNLVNTPQKETTGKIMYTSNEKLRTLHSSLSDFCKFELYHTDLFENGLAGPIQPLNDSDSSSNDEFLIFDSDKPTASKENGSPISPDYETLQVVEVKNHFATMGLENLNKPNGNVNSTTTESVSSLKSGNDENVTTKIPKNRITNKDDQNSSVCGASNTGGTIGSALKRKHNENDTNNVVFKKPRVNFGNYQVRYIPKPTTPPLLSDEVIEAARESIEVYNIKINDQKLFCMKPQVLLEMDTMNGVKEKQDRLKDNDEEKVQQVKIAIHNLIKIQQKSTERSSIVQRVDYKKQDDYHEICSVSSCSTATSNLPNCSESGSEFGHEGNEDYGTVPNKPSSLSKSRRKTVALKKRKSPSAPSSSSPIKRRKKRQKRRRGRPRKPNIMTMEKQNLENRCNVGGIVYTDKPFRSEDLKCVSVATAKNTVEVVYKSIVETSKIAWL